MQAQHNRQVISIGPDGLMSGLQVKPGKGLDLRQFGKASIKRASEIDFDEEVQKWTIHILQGKHADRHVTFGNLVWACEIHNYDAGTILDEACLDVGTDIMLFDEYDTAVKWEIAFLDAVRLTYGSEAL